MYSFVKTPENAQLAHEITKLARAETRANNMRTAAYAALLCCLVIYGAIASRELGNAKIHGTVELAPGGKVTVRQDEPLTVKGEITANIPRAAEEQKAAQPASNAKVMTNITRFETVDMPPGQVVTGWTFDDSLQERPSHQYCYYSQTLDENAHATITIGYDGAFTPPKRFPAGLKLDAAFRNCVWAK